LRAPRHDSLRTVSLLTMAVPMVITVGLGEALNSSEGDDRGELGLHLGRILEQGRKNSKLQVVIGLLYGAGVRASSHRRGRRRRQRGEKADTPSCCPPGTMERMRMTSSR
jgi:hypothetical protein